MSDIIILRNYRGRCKLVSITPNGAHWMNQNLVYGDQLGYTILAEGIEDLVKKITEEGLRVSVV